MTMPQPELLRWDNWTPPARTPWGGRKIPEHFKAGLALPDDLNEGVVGESWELSVDPTFPSRLWRTDALLAEVIAAHPDAWLGAHAHLKATPILVKLLDARENLSVQVHPSETDPSLAPHESGKPEAWVVLDREPGAGIYLGLADGVERSELERQLAAGEDISAALNFVPVEPGDAFVIEAGTVHAVGAGVTLLEPQLIMPGRSGVTCRFWDWGRRYDAQGRQSPEGQPRPLHLARSLAVTSWERARGQSFVEQCRVLPSLRAQQPQLSHAFMLDLRGLILERFAGQGRIALTDAPTFLGLVVTKGVLSFGDIHVRQGQTLVIPASWKDREINLSGECFTMHMSC